jgi:hypothetical protein
VTALLRSAFPWITLWIAVLARPPFPASATALYPARFYPATADSALATPIVLAPGETSTPLLLVLRQAGGSLGVRILDDESGAPIAGILVEAAIGDFRAYAKSDASGRAVVTGVPAGQVAVSARTDDPRNENGAYEPATVAAPVWVREGAQTEAGDLRLRLGGRVKPTVLRPSGSPWPDIPVVLKSVDGMIRRQARTDTEGRARLGGIPPGSYLLWADTRGTEALPEAWDGSRDTVGSTPLEIGRGSLFTSIEIATDMGAIVTGTIRDRNGNLGIPDAEVRVIGQQQPKTTYTFRTDRLGFYFANGLPGGSYKVYVPLLLRWYPDATSEATARSIQVVEGAVSIGINITGDPLAECTLSGQQACAVNGAVRADFDIMPRATIVVWNESDTAGISVTSAGAYTVGCIPAGTYRIRMVPDGGYRTQYHKKTNAPDSALVVTIAAGDTARAVDFEPQRSVVIEGIVEDEDSRLPLEGVRIFASRTHRDFAETRTNASGSFRLDRLADGSGLPAGKWIVGADSIAITEMLPTPIRTIRLDIARHGILVRIGFDLPGDLVVSDWVVERRCGDGEAVTVNDASTHPEGTRARAIVDAGGNEGCEYRLTVELGQDGGGRIESSWTAVSATAARSVFPSPWDGRSVLRLPDLVMPDTPCVLLSPDGSRVLTLRASGPDVLPPAAAHLASGVYFLRWRDASGLERTSRVVVKR